MSDTFVVDRVGPRQKHERISDDMWESYKDIIVSNYRKMPLVELRKVMSRDHNFHATIRQLGHRLREVWKIKKYKLEMPVMMDSIRAERDESDGAATEPAPQLADRTSSSPVPSTGSSHPVPPVPRRDAPIMPMIGTVSTAPGTTAVLLGTERVPTTEADMSLLGTISGYGGDVFRATNFATGKRTRNDENDTHFPCPFRKRNPRRFNIRDHLICATHSPPDIGQLKRHVLVYHAARSAGSRCPRCKKWFTTMDELTEHLAVPANQICEVVTATPLLDPEDGLTDEAKAALITTTSANKIISWDQLWLLLFPQDSRIPSPDFHPPLEHFELGDFVEEWFPKLASAELKRSNTVYLTESEVTDILRGTLRRVINSFPEARVSSRGRNATVEDRSLPET